jgi:hypothetical protein
MISSSLSEERVLAAVSLVQNKTTRQDAVAEALNIGKIFGGFPDKEFVEAALRADIWTEQCLAFVDEQEKIDFIAVESFVDQRSRAREDKQRLVSKRWQTPLVIGLLQAGLAERNITVQNGRLIYQNAGIVIRQLSTEIERLKSRRGKQDVVIPGDHIVTNDHQRKALAHALALSTRIKENNRVI